MLPRKRVRRTRKGDFEVRLSDGESFPADTLVWTTGVKAETIAARSGFPVDHAGRVVTVERE